MGLDKWRVEERQPERPPVGPRVGAGAKASVPDGSIEWPDGKTSAFVATFDFDAEEVWIGDDPANAHRPGVLSQGTYGARAGLPLLLALLESLAWPATFFVPGRVAEAHAERVERILAAGRAGSIWSPGCSSTSAGTRGCGWRPPARSPRPPTRSCRLDGPRRRPRDRRDRCPHTAGPCPPGAGSLERR